MRRERKIIMDELLIDNLNDITTALPNISSTANYWLIRAQGGDYFDDFIANQYAGVGFDEVSLEEVSNSSNEQLRDLFAERKPTKANGSKIASGTYTSWVGQLRRFTTEIAPGDYILVPSQSSERFALGIVIGAPYEMTDDQISSIEKVAGRINSPYKKRIKVQYLKQFSRSKADSALYKMIYTQQTLSNINKYAPYILRASYDAYVSNNQIFLTFHVGQKTDVSGRDYTGFTYNLVEAHAELEPEQEVVIKSNVQSEGDVQLILAITSMVGIFLLALVTLRSKKGFSLKVKFGKDNSIEFTKEADSIVAQRVEDAKSERKIKEQKAFDEHLKNMSELLNKSGQHMEKIDAMISTELDQATKKAGLSNTDKDV